MDAHQFDWLVRDLAAIGTRRRLLALLAALPVIGSLAAFLAGETAAAGRRKRRKKRHKHRSGDDKDHRKGQRKGKDKGKKKCRPQPDTVTCAGKCAIVVNNCGGTIDCGPCSCGGCPQCQICNAATGQCVPVADGTACDDDDACTQSDTCQGGVCVGSDPVVCTPLDACHVAGVCDPATGLCSNPAGNEGNPCDDDNPCTTGTTCQSGVCTGGTPMANHTACGDNNQCCNGECCSGCCGDGGACAACLVFTTLVPHSGALGGLDGAAERCQLAALPANLPGSDIFGNYQAWLSDNTGSPSTRFRCTAAACSGEGYTLTNRTTVVASDWADLTTCDGSGCLDHTIDRDAGNSLIIGGDHLVWTNTTTIGTLDDATSNCGNWTSGSSGTGLAGDFTFSSARWTEDGPTSCANPRHLYCFQQS